MSNFYDTGDPDISVIRFAEQIPRGSMTVGSLRPLVLAIHHPTQTTAIGWGERSVLACRELALKRLRETLETTRLWGGGE